MNSWVRHSIIFALAAMVSAGVGAAPKEKLYQWYEVKGLKAPADGFLMEGKTTRRLADFKGQVVVLNIWATWCTPCLKELPTLDALEEKYGPDGLVVLPLSVDTMEFEQLQQFIQKLELELPHLAQDRNNTIFNQLKGAGLPVTYLIGRDGALRARYAGGTDWLDEEHTQRIEALLAESEAR